MGRTFLRSSGVGVSGLVMVDGLTGQTKLFLHPELRLIHLLRCCPWRYSDFGYERLQVDTPALERVNPRMKFIFGERFPSGEVVRTMVWRGRGL